MKVIAIDTTENVEIRDIHGLTDMQNIVGGPIEIVHAKNLQYPLVMVVNEEGYINEMPVNLFGSILYGGPILGNIFICEEGRNKDGDLDFVDFAEGVEEVVLAQIKTHIQQIKLIKETNKNGN